MPANKNCLLFMRCPNPKCEAHDDPSQLILEIAGYCNMTVDDDGIEDYSDPEWDANCVAWCKNCGFSGEIYEFEKDWQNKQKEDSAEKLREVSKEIDAVIEIKRKEQLATMGVW